MFARPQFRRRKGPLWMCSHHASQSYYGPGQLPVAYGWPAAAAEVVPQTIVIGELGGKFYPSDVAAWAKEAGLPTPNVTTYLLPGADASASDADGEVALDWQRAAEAYSHLTGMPAEILLVYGPNSGSAFAAAHQYANTLKNVGAFSWSWGAPEDTWAAADLSALGAAVLAAAYPTTAAAGDNDSGDGTSAPDVDAPACLPVVVSCGGTSRPPAGGAEVVWNNGNGEGTGGGFSKLYPRPSWQPANPQGTGRMVPDWAVVADPNTGYNTLVAGQWDVVGGTSAAAPELAGFLAAVNGARAKAGLAPLAQANAALWAQAACFLDITAGNNGAYWASAGPDPCSGMGRPLGTLFAALAGLTKTPPPPPPPTQPASTATLASAFPAGLFVAFHPGSRGVSEFTLSAALAAGTYTLTKE
jgi:kumamolisin